MYQSQSFDLQESQETFQEKRGNLNSNNKDSARHSTTSGIIPSVGQYNHNSVSNINNTGMGGMGHNSVDLKNDTGVDLIDFNQLQKLFQKLTKHANFQLNIPHYDLKQYWDRRYELQQGHTMEWLISFPKLVPHIQSYLNKRNMESTKILDAGCGNSNLGEDAFSIGYKDITCIDFSENVIDQMLSQNKKQFKSGGIGGGGQGPKYLLMNVLNMQFQFGTFDVIFDQGTMDSIIVNEQKGFDNALYFLANTDKILKPGGVFFSISHAEPALRINMFLTKTNWKVQVVGIEQQIIPEFYQIDKSKQIYVYVCEKQK